jgi:hypothetical protein
VCVTQIVESDAWQTAVPHVLVEHLSEPIGVNRVAVLPTEDEAQVLVCLSELQGWRDNDFCWTVGANWSCSHRASVGAGVDEDCGCRRSMSSVVSQRATTTIKVSFWWFSERGKHVTGPYQCPASAPCFAGCRENPHSASPLASGFL